MRKLPSRQRGASLIVVIILIALLGYGIFVGIQYVPQMIEAHTVDSILKDIEKGHRVNRIDSLEVANLKVVKMLQVNEMDDLTKSYTVKHRNGRVTIEFSYERPLDLGYEVKQMRYLKTLSLN
jgi:hypothetical protein